MIQEKVARTMVSCFQGEEDSGLRLTVLSKGSNSRSWTVDTQSGRRLVLRCALGNDGPEALEAMAAAALAVAAAGITTKTPLPAPDGSYTVLDTAGRPWQCWTWLDGHSPTGSDAEAFVLGATLRRFHEALGVWLHHGQPAHEPYWPQRFDRGDILAALAALDPAAADRHAARTLALEAYEMTAGTEKLAATAGHGDCHTDNWLILSGSARAALIDLELIGSRPGAQLTDLGVLMHRMARLAAMRTSSSSQGGLEAALALARGYGSGLKTVAVAFSCAIQESLAKVIGCALDGPPGLDRAARNTVAANHFLYLRELAALKSGLDGLCA